MQWRALAPGPRPHALGEEAVLVPGLQPLVEIGFRGRLLIPGASTFEGGARH